MLSAQQTLDRQYLEMRSRVLSLAADLDRLQRAEGGSELLKSDLRIDALRNCVHELLSDSIDRAARVQMILSDKTPPPR